MFNITKYHQSDCISTFYHQQFMRIIIVPYPFQQADFFIRHFYSFQSCRSEMIIFFHHHTLIVKLMMVSLLDETVNLIILLCDKREGCINHFCCILKYDGCPEEKQYVVFWVMCWTSLFFHGMPFLFERRLTNYVFFQTWVFEN